MLTPGIKTRNLLTYGQLVLREAPHHGGPGWLEYDKIFRQHATLDLSVQWIEQNLSLHTSTIMTYQAGSSQCCVLYHEPDHGAHSCALLDLQAYPPPLPPASRDSTGNQNQSTEPICCTARPETLERICISWNHGHCTFLSSSFRHVCATCKRRGHRAKDCNETLADLSYKTAASTSPRSSRQQGAGDRPTSST